MPHQFHRFTLRHSGTMQVGAKRVPQRMEIHHPSLCVNLCNLGCLQMLIKQWGTRHQPLECQIICRCGCRPEFFQRVNDSRAQMVAERVGERVVDDLKRPALIVALEVFHVL